VEFFLSLFVQFRREIFLAQYSNPQNRQGKAYLFFLLIRILLEMFFSCFYCCARTFGELLRKRIETSRTLQEGLIEAQDAAFFLPVCQIRVHTTGGKTSEGIDVLV
jgi:hypothetical protein